MCGSSVHHEATVLVGLLGNSCRVADARAGGTLRNFQKSPQVLPGSADRHSMVNVMEPRHCESPRFAKVHGEQPKKDSVVKTCKGGQGGVRLERVNILREALASGTYTISKSQLADCLLERMLRLGNVTGRR